MIIEGKRVTLKPLVDKEYFLDLADKDNKGLYTRDGIAKLIDQYGTEFWVIYHEDIPRGVVGYFKFGNVYFLEALKDHAQKKGGLSHSVEVGQLVLKHLDEFTDIVYTCARRSDPAIQLLCKKLGFKEIDKMQDFNFGEKEDLIFYRRDSQNAHF